MAIFNTNEFLRKTFSKTIFGTAALRPEAVCADGFTLSIQASGMTAYRKICFALILSSGCRVNRTADTPRTKL